MSLLQELGAQIRSASDELPLAAVAAAADRLRVAIDLLTWVRQASARPIGVPQLAGALEHGEHAVHALLVAREQVAAYLTAIGLGSEAAPGDPLGHRVPVAQAAAAQPDPGSATVAPLRRWWSERVDVLTDGSGGYEESGAAPDSAELLRRVAARAGSGDRAGLRSELVRSSAPVGLGLAALAPGALRRLAEELLGHPPRPQDLARLVQAVRARVRELLPGLRPDVAELLLGRACRVPAPQSGEGRQDNAGRPSGTDRAAGSRPADGADGADSRPAPPHPADSAIAGAVLVGALLQRLHRDPGEIDRYLTPEPADA
jgi:hypothetical protein